MPKLTKSFISHCLVATGFLLILIVPEVSAWTNRCPCKYHNAEAHGIGTCSRSEDRHRCTIEFSITTPKEYNNFVNYLYRIGLEADPRKSLEFATIEPPAKWDNTFVTDNLPVLFAISMRLGFQEQMPTIMNILNEKTDDILKALQKESPEYKEMDINGFNVIVSYGCIEFRSENFATMVKTPWSREGCYCDFSKPPWIK